MKDNKEKIAQVLRTAIKGEQDGYYFYNLLAEKATNDEARRKLEGLRDDEIRHEQTLEEIFKKYVGSEIGELPKKGLSALSEVFNRGQAKELKTEIEFLNLAIEAELAASKYYQTERNLVDDPEFQAIFDSLAEEEDGHYQLLMAEREAMTGNYYWFGYGDSSPMED